MAGVATQHELTEFLQQRPDLRFIDLLLHDINGIDRGKRIDRNAATETFAAGLPMPGSLLALDIEGGTVEATGLGTDQGDADRPCRPVAGTLVDVPWLEHAVAQAQLGMYEPDGRPFYADPRHLLEAMISRFWLRGLIPVVAIEPEFYFVDFERAAGGMPQPPRGPLTGRRESRAQINSMTDLDEYSSVLTAIHAACHAQRVPATSCLAEYGPGQFEVNLAHGADALAVCDQAMRFKRIVKSVARRHNMDATFLAKPYREAAGSGLHVHVSINDVAGNNVFSDPSTQGGPSLQYAINGCLETMLDGTAIFGPNANSWRRFRPGTYTPLGATWSVNHRGAAIRVPAGDAANRRLDHRVAGADGNPYLVVTWILGGILKGLDMRRLPPPALDGDAASLNDGNLNPLPRHWPVALERFVSSSVAAEILGTAFHKHFATVKLAELEAFSTRVTPWECEQSLAQL